MDKKIILTIKGNQRGPDGEDNYIEFITEGRLFKKDDIYYIEYQESEISGLDGTVTLISVDDKRISMERSGAYKSQIIFEEGKKFLNSYHTPFGNMEMGVYSTNVDSVIGDKEGMLDLKYQLDVGGMYTSSNELILRYSDNSRDIRLKDQN